LKIVPYTNESIDNTLKRFKAEVGKAGVLKELKLREYYLSPADKRKVKAKMNRKKKRK